MSPLGMQTLMYKVPLLTAATQSGPGNRHEIQAWNAQSTSLDKDNLPEQLTQIVPNWNNLFPCLSIVGQ